MPEFIQVEVSRRCNVRCWTCWAAPGPDAALMEWGLFENVLPMVGPGCHVELFGAGEPLMHPRFADMAWAVVGRGGTWGTSTNGMLLTPELVAKLPKAEAHWIIVSIHGATPEMHELMQRGVISGRVWRHVRQAADAGLPVLVAAVAMAGLLEQLPALARKAHEHGARGLILYRLLNAYEAGHGDADPFLAGREGDVRAAACEVRRYCERVGMVLHDRLGIN